MNLWRRNRNGKGKRGVMIIIRGLVLKKFIMIRQIEELVDENIIGGDNIVGIKTTIFMKTELGA